MNQELRKPREGDPCNGCGVCCMASLCPLGTILHYGPIVAKFLDDRDLQMAGPCKALEWEDGRSWCGLVRHPERFHDVRQYLAPTSPPTLEILLGPEGEMRGKCDSTAPAGWRPGMPRKRAGARRPPPAATKEP